MAGFFVRHKQSGFETYIPSDQWHESMRDEYHVRDPDAELQNALARMREDSDRHDAALKGRPKAEPAPSEPEQAEESEPAAKPTRGR